MLTHVMNTANPSAQLHDRRVHHQRPETFPVIVRKDCRNIDRMLMPVAGTMLCAVMTSPLARVARWGPRAYLDANPIVVVTASTLQ